MHTHSENPIMNRCVISKLGNILPAFESKLGNWLICVAVTAVGRYAVVYRDLKSVRLK